MASDRKTRMTVRANPPCEMCGGKTLIHSDHSGGWDECVSCGWMQNIHHTPGGQPGKLTGLAPDV